MQTRWMRLAPMWQTVDPSAGPTPEPPVPDAVTPEPEPPPATPEPAPDLETPPWVADLKTDLGKILAKLDPGDVDDLASELTTPAAAAPTAADVTPAEETAPLGEAAESAMPEPVETPEAPEETPGRKRKAFGRRR